jgi:hypothetical protein
LLQVISSSLTLSKKTNRFGWHNPGGHETCDRSYYPPNSQREPHRGLSIMDGVPQWGVQDQMTLLTEVNERKEQ